jgi:putative PIG3 family NAD(P)H quinone oxidoreductase
MKAIIVKEYGGPEQLKVGELSIPTIGPDDLLVKIEASAVNRADLLQRAGKYPPPPGESNILGLEMAGRIVDKGMKVKDWKIGDAVCGLLGGGGYAEYCIIHQDMALPIPGGLSFQEAAAIPEVFLTAYQALHWLAKINYEERILIHAGASGVGSAAIQLALLKKAEIIVTASANKHPLCKEMGAHFCIDYKEDDFAEMVNEYTEGKGVDVIIDFIGAPYYERNIKCLALDGRMVILGLLGGLKMQEPTNLAPLLFKRLQIMGSTLRSRDLNYKISLSQELKERTWPHFETGALRPVIDSVFPISEVGSAHRRMAANQNQGKIILRI